jgi:membrane fusion protein, multidrug efflux system
MRVTRLCCLAISVLLLTPQTVIARDTLTTPAIGGLSEWQVRALVVSPRTAEISGAITAKILSMPTRIGTRISRGKPLIQFDCALYKAQLAEAQADYAGAKSRLQAKEGLRELKAAGKLEIEVAEAEYQNAEAKVRSARVYVNRCQIPAPFDCVVVTLHAKPHEILSSGESLLEVLDDSVLQIDLVVSSSWLRWLKKGTPLKMHIDEISKDISATVVAINGRIDAVSQTVNIIAEIKDKPAGLIAGMSGTASFSPPDE